MKIRILTDSDITETVFDQMIGLENSYWPEGHFAHLSREYVDGLFSSSRESIFVAWDDETDSLAGHFYVIVTDEDNIREYFEKSDFTVLQNKGFKPGGNILYLYTAILKKEYHGSGCMKEMCIAFCRWLDEKQSQGCYIDKAYAEAVSRDGGKTCSQGFGMLPMDDVDEEGIGHYISPDGLNSYRQKMRKYC